MEKKSKKFTCIALLMLVIQFFITPISGCAESVYGNLEFGDIRDAYGIGSNGAPHIAGIGQLKLNGHLVFCIEPYKITHGGSYEGNPDFDPDSISHRAVLATALWDKVLNPTSINDYRIAQAVVWSTLDGEDKFDVEHIDGIEDEYFNVKKKELNDLITDYDKKPSFDGQTVKLKLGETTEIANTVAGVDLREFDKQVSNSANIHIETRQNKLLITPTDKTKKNGNLEFKKSYKEGTPYMYKRAGVQTVYEGKIRNTNSYTLNFDIETTGSIEITKLDENKKTLEGVEFTIFTKDDKEITKVQTDKNGVAKVDNLSLDDYHFKETKSLPGYVVNSNPVEFSIKETGKINKVTVENKSIRGSIEITKMDVADRNTKLPNTEFTIYNEQGQKVGNRKTNEEGIATFENLPFGKYTYRETIAPEGYLMNETVFAFEILENGEVIKKKVEDEKIPSVKTTATDKYGGTKELHATKSVTIQDKVEYENLIVGKEYTAKGKLMNKTTNKQLFVNEKEVTAEAKFVPTEANGSISLDFTFDATGLEDNEVVVFEDLINEGKIITTHADIKNQKQTVKFVKPSIHTVATNKEDGTKEIHTTKSVIIQDNVKYENLIVGKGYTVKGKLMDKSTNKPLLVEGKEVTTEAKFTPKEKNSSVTVDFIFDATSLENKDVVVFEDICYGDTVVATHADIEDKSQTVKFVKPTIQTTATNKVDDSKELDVSKIVTIQDKVEYTDLIVGKDYTVKGKLMDKTTNKPLLVGGKEIIAKAKFTAEKTDGSITLDFTFDASNLKGKEVVVFEKLLYTDNVVAVHANIHDQGQTVKFKEVTPTQPKHEIAQTGGSVSKLPLIGFGLILLASTFFVLARRTKNNKEN
nr:VaFE repeat-containing surface-anchored protein [Bacillus cereus]